MSTPPFAAQAVHGRLNHEHLGRCTHRLWHGTSSPAAWEKGLGAAEWHPFSRRYAVRMPGASPGQPMKEKSPVQRSHSIPSGQHAQHSMTSEQHAQHSMTSGQHAQHSMTSGQHAQPSATASLPLLQPVPYMVPVAIPTRPTAVPMPAAAAAPRSIYVGNLMGSNAYRNTSPPIGDSHACT